MGIPHLGNTVASCRIKSLLKLAQGQLNGIPNTIVLNLGINLCDVLKLSYVELDFLALTFKRLNLNYILA